MFCSQEGMSYLNKSVSYFTGMSQLLDIAWTIHSTPVEPRTESCHAILNGTLYLIGGKKVAGGDTLKTTEKLNLATGQWTKGFDLKSPMWRPCCAAVSEMEFVTVSIYSGETYKYNVETGMAVKYDDAPFQVMKPELRWSLANFIAEFCNLDLKTQASNMKLWACEKYATCNLQYVVG